MKVYAFTGLDAVTHITHGRLQGQIANGLEADHAGRLSVAIINRQFRDTGGSYEEYSAAVKAAIAHGWLTMHPSGAYLSFTQAGADKFA
jgi:hypothetical protein